MRNLLSKFRRSACQTSRKQATAGCNVTFERLEDRRMLAATIVEADPISTGLIYEQYEGIFLEFDDIMVGLEEADNFTLINAGADELFDTADDTPIALWVDNTDEGIMVDLHLTNVEVGRYRLTVSDAITDESGDALDGDEDGNPGGDWVRVFDAIPLGPMGAEFQVNSSTIGPQDVVSNKSVAMDAAGNFVVTWSSNQNDGNGYDVYAQLYDAAGTALGGEFAISADANYHHEHSSVAMDAEGNFVVTWTRKNIQGSSHRSAFGQRYDATGTAVGAEFQIDTRMVGGSDDFPSVAMNSSGSFVVTWTDNDGSNSGVFGKLYDATGTAVGNEFQVNSHVDDSQENSSVAMDATGNFVVTWSSFGQDGSGSGVYGQLFDAAGTAVGSEFQVNTQFDGHQERPSVAMDALGNFAVTWTTESIGGVWSSVNGQRYDAAGTRVGGEFQVNSDAIENRTQRSSLAMDAAGNFVVTWSSEGGDGFSPNVSGQRYDAAGAALGGEFQINSQTFFGQRNPSVAMLDAEHYVVTWNSTGQDGGGHRGVFGQMSNPVVTIPAGSGTVYVSRIGDDVSITKDGQPVATIALESVLGITLTGAAESETFSIDIDGLNPGVLPSGITIAAGEGTGDDDTLELIGSTTVDNYDYTTGGPESGTITLDGFTVTFSEFEPIIDQLNVQNRSFSIGTPGNQTIVLGDDGGAADGFSIISDGGTGAFESVAFLPPTENLTLDAGDGDDQVIIQQTDDGFNVPVSVAGGDGNDTIDSSQANITLVLDGGGGNDTITGGAGSNVIIGGEGDDTLIDGGGTNTIVTGGGTDDIQQGSGTNTVVTDTGAGNNGPLISASAGNVAVGEGETARKTGTFFDLDETDNVTISTDFGVIAFQDTGNSGAWTWKYNAAGALPRTTVTVTADDGSGATSSLSFDVTIGAVNTAPTATGQSVEVTEDGHVAFTLVGNDAETPADSLLFTVETVPTSGSLFTPTGDRVEVGAVFSGAPTLEYQPGASRAGEGSDGFSFSVSDNDVGGALTSAAADVSVNIVQAVEDGAVTIDSDGILRIGGTTGNDRILVTRSLFTGQLRTWINGQRVGPAVAAADVSEIHAWGREGNDKIIVLGVGADTLIHGGAGNDRVIGDYRSDLIFGGAGNDRLFGSFGDDMLVGGADVDKLFGSFGDDILIGGELSETLVADDLHDALDQWSEEGLISEDLADGVLDDAAFDRVFGGFGDDWNGVS
ncbi:Ig-like domain-containing protein [Bythopirellula goksoeyrii]|uniref:RapA2 cadherin-like domain-containing protein n=1 Tax=Bythopirellula goksoeyrii TaxID=1400387 RepID=A0A5B9QBX8_9BACT|nr:Ig-like domain-containing protein [Bythopirellula goksoeyrii]QEG34416.1 hypothetical protein Pr1d_16950 [Bythopirellula goksoeyrii]